MNAELTQAASDTLSLDPIAQQGVGALSTSDGARAYIAHHFVNKMRRHDFAAYIANELAADFACALAQQLATTGRQPAGDILGRDLPQLPEAFEAEFSPPGVSPVSIYTAEQMQDYARAALAARQPGAQVPPFSHDTICGLQYGIEQLRDIERGQWKAKDWDSSDNYVTANIGHAKKVAAHILPHLTEAVCAMGDMWYVHNAAPPAQGMDTDNDQAATHEPNTSNNRLTQGIDLEHARGEGHDGAIRYVLGYLNGVGDRGSTMYEEILNACGRERIIRSAIADDELGFTGLDWYIENRGTDADRALIDQRDAAPGVGH